MISESMILMLHLILRSLAIWSQKARVSGNMMLGTRDWAGKVISYINLLSTWYYFKLYAGIIPQFNCSSLTHFTYKLWNKATVSYFSSYHIIVYRLGYINRVETWLYIYNVTFIVFNIQLELRPGPIWRFEGCKRNKFL